MTTSCTITAYDEYERETNKRLSLVSCSNGMVEVQIENSIGNAIWVDGDELKRAVENKMNRNKLD